MAHQLPPTIDPVAAARWAKTLAAQSPWLHEEVARRMQERLQWMVSQPATWLHWEPLRGGLQAHQLIRQRYPKAQSYAVEKHPAQRALLAQRLTPAWWQPARWTEAAVRFDAPSLPVEMLWSNMALHMESDPLARIAHWHSLVGTNGFLMFSCLGPDTLKQLRAIYQRLGWPPASHQFTDMHDWGDMLVRAGFAEPVMDMERITLTFSSPQNLLAELRGLGRNLHPQRFSGLRGRAWQANLHKALSESLTSKDALQDACEDTSARLELTFEIIYGHAFKPLPKFPVQAQTSLSLDDMRRTLKQTKT